MDDQARLGSRPVDRSDNPNRTHRLKPPLDSKKVDGQKLPQWQHEITGAGRIHYSPDKATRTVWVTMVDLSHPENAKISAAQPMTGSQPKSTGRRAQAGRGVLSFIPERYRRPQVGAASTDRQPEVSVDDPVGCVGRVLTATGNGARLCSWNCWSP